MEIQFVRIHFSHWDSEWTLAIFNTPGLDMHDRIYRMIEEYKSNAEDMDDDSAVVTYVMDRLNAMGILFLQPSMCVVEVE